MCEFVSWIEHEGRNYFIENTDLETKDGERLLLSDVKIDLCGHGAIISYYPELKGKGVKKECIDFTTPKNFPKDIVKAIKEGGLSNIGICLEVLSTEGNKQYQKTIAPALEQYQKTNTQALERYEKTINQAPEPYEKMIAPAWEQYEKINTQAWEQYKTAGAQAFSKIVKQKKYRNEEWK